MQAKGKGKAGGALQKMTCAVKEFFHPSQVTWPGFKETKNKTVLVIMVTIVLAVLLLAFDAVSGLILRITTVW